MWILLIIVVVVAFIAARARNRRRQIGSASTPMQVAPQIVRDPSQRMGRTRRGYSTRRRF